MASSSSFLLVCFLSLLSLLSIIPCSYSDNQNDSSTDHGFLYDTFVIASADHTLINTADDPYKIVLPLKRMKKSMFLDAMEKLIYTAKVSRARAQTIKNRKEIISGNKTGVFPKSYGEYEVSLNFGTPPQPISFILDTGGDLVWFPCTTQYSCIECNRTPVVPDGDVYFSPKRQIFYPEKSSSSKRADCYNKICRFIRDDNQPSCYTNGSCVEYTQAYGSGQTNGTLLSETLHFGNKAYPNFMGWCSTSTYHTESGIVGFGRDLPSLPSQMGVRKFSHCFLSKLFNDTSKSSPLVLHMKSESDNDDKKVDGISYTPFVTNKYFTNYYYVELTKITMGGKDVEIPNEYLSINPKDGHGGAMIDSGNELTHMDKRIYDLVAKEMVKQVKHYKRVEEVETGTMLTPCYEMPLDAKEDSYPKLGFHFKGGAKMDLPVINTFSFVNFNDTKVACLAIVSGDGNGPIAGGGPSVILGNFQQQEYYIEYDLQNKRLGFGPKDCSE